MDLHSAIKLLESLPDSVEVRVSLDFDQKIAQRLKDLGYLVVYENSAWGQNQIVINTKLNESK